MSSVDLLRFHRSMVEDAVRVDCFRRAIEASVKSGDVVLDLGSGTGVLAILAARAGARVVYAVEATEVVEIAREVCRENGVADRVRFFDDVSSRVKLPEPADILITETIGNFGLDEGILGWVRDARRRLLKPDAVIVPHSIELHTVPVEMPEAYARDIDWDYVRSGIDFRSMRLFAVNNLYRERVRPENYLAAPCSLGEIDLGEVSSTAFAADAVFEVSRTGELHGLGGWFSSRLYDGITVSNDPNDSPGSWKHAFMPFETPISVERGQRLNVHVACANNGSVWRWRLAGDRVVENANRECVERPEFDQSTFYGSPGMASHLHRQAASHAPELNADGRVTRFLLDLMDGTRTLEDLSVLAAESFPDKFSDPAEALAHVRALSAELAS